ncbi:TPA: ECF transporter S component [Streptococcus equi subsp. zooepidemicus]|uniref:ECF transporter S component n=1 Tax=Streptococcus equi TaxID=1336 RepID=UPI0005B2672A|nr:ECF transporter S component [Streptococcus equi]HEL0216378.1 ECF transporter S component [Streptococcus equi subsp. zooepidemicus]HEL0221497.1 ECF transporter S component [Streptococcus equi subsp. zooepidemicus]HEL0422959.1 ECF transporter S component [Streptococcus equi subsp. zooepidemicus]HEL0467689.1 ECF transporter S component [Streptococcus equi subsp. zooepidemicus]HEL0483889.1 ECF transporter S component [Streptococcus equi subsp. zooepidemicus]
MSKTHRLVMVAILSAISFCLMFVGFSIIPGANFLKIDFSIIPILLGLVLMDLKQAYLILAVRTLLRLALNNHGVNDLIGIPMNVIAVALFITAFALIWHRQKGLVTYVLASLVGTGLLTLGMVIMNYVFAIPLYAKFAGFDIKASIGIARYIFTMVIPFNLLEGLIFAIVFYFVYIAGKPILERYPNSYHET